MKSRIAVLGYLAVLTCVSAAADEIYRWVDEQGVTHYSDVPQDGAEKVELQPAVTFSAPPRPKRSSSRKQPGATEETDAYQGFTIVRPGAEETIWNTAGAITVSVSPTPALLEGHSVNIYLNGQLLDAKAPTSLSAEISEVPRGEHTLTAEILDATGRTVISAQPVKFFYRQTLIPNATTPRIRQSPAVLPRPRVVNPPVLQDVSRAA